MAQLYSLRKRVDTEELHVFLSHTKEDKCHLSTISSICGACSNKDAVLYSKQYHCLEEKNMREECAKIGRPVCANCIKTFYTTY